MSMLAQSHWTSTAGRIKRRGVNRAAGTNQSRPTLPPAACSIKMGYRPSTTDQANLFALWSRICHSVSAGHSQGEPRQPKVKRAAPNPSEPPRSKNPTAKKASGQEFPN